MDEEYSWRTGRSCFYKIQLHIVFVTKYRRGVFTRHMLDRINELFAETCKQMEGELLEFNGENDHVHIMLTCPPKLAISNLIGKLKGKSSYFLRKEYGSELKKKLWGKHLWSPSYCVVSSGVAPIEIIKQYIENQRRPLDPKSVKKSKSLTGRKRPQSIA